MSNKAKYIGLLLFVAMLGLTNISQAANILTHPVDQRGSEGFPVLFTITAEGEGVTYQWMKNNVDIPDAVNSSYAIDNIAFADNGALFQCRVTTPDGRSQTSLEAQLVVYQKGDYDWDGDIDNNDVYYLQQKYRKHNHKWRYHDDDENNHAPLVDLAEFDWNGDGKINVEDMYLLEQQCTTTNCEVIEDQSPVIVRQPEFKILQEGDTARFMVKVAGDNLQYQWQKNGVNIPGGNARRLRLRNIQFEENGSRFKCVVTNSYGVATSREVVLTIFQKKNNYWKRYWRDFWDDSSDDADDSQEEETDPTIFQINRPPFDMSVVEGDIVRFRVFARGRYLSYQWFRNGEPIEGATRKKYKIRDVTMADDGARFQCKITKGQDSIMSDEATLTVYQQGDFDWDRDIDREDVRVVRKLLYSPRYRNWEANFIGKKYITLKDLRYLIKMCTCPECQVPEPAVIIEEPEDNVVVENTPATFTVEATGIRLGYQWQVNGVDIPGATEPSYTIANTQLLDHGKLYTCIITNAGGTVTTRAAELQVEMNIPPNEVAITGLEVVWQQDKAALSWEEAEGMRYQIHRGKNADDMELIAETADLTYLDENAAYYFGWYYRIAAIKDYVHPVSNESFHSVGPLSEAVLLAAQPSPSVQLVDIPLGEDGNHTTYFITGTTIKGSYRNMNSPVTVTATGPATLTQESTSGTFGFIPQLPGVWEITAAEKNGFRSAKTKLVLQSDTLAPRLTLQTNATMETSAASVTIAGEAQENESGLESIQVESDTYGQTFGGAFSSGGAFQISVPVKAGENTLSVIVKDKAGNESTAQVTVQVTLPTLPQVAIISPVNGSTVNSDTINVSGTVRSSLDPDKIRLLFRGQVYFPQGSGGMYQFSFTNVKLQKGSNAIKVTAETSHGNVSAQALVNYKEPEEPTEPEPPEVEIFSTPPEGYITGNEFQVSGITTTGAEIVSVTINGQPATITGNGATVSFEGLLNFNGESSLVVTIVIVDSNGQTTTLTYTVYRDSGAPTLTLINSSLQEAPHINAVKQTPYHLEGTVSDENLAGFSVNNQAIGLLPGDNGEFRFNVPLNLVQGEETLFSLKAWDKAGNITTKGISFRLDSGLNIEVVSPREGAEVATEGDTVILDIAFKAPGLAETDQLAVTVDGVAVTGLVRNSSNVYGQVELPLAAGRHNLSITISNSDGATLATTSSGFEVIDTRLLPLSLERQEPANNSTGVENNGFLAFYFNKSVDPALLEIQVFETYHGKDYAKTPSGADMTSLSNIEMEEVHRDRELVSGGVSHFPEQTMAAFYPARNFAFGATVYVTLIYDGQELTSTTFKVKPLPTFIQGFVTDQFGDPVEGITVSIPSLQRSVSSDKEGSFAFGFGEKANETIPAGRHRVVVNPRLENHRFGSMEFFATVTQGRLNEVGMNILPVINLQEPFRYIESGAPQAILGAGELTLDLSDATVGFADGSSAGNVHAQFLTVNEQPYGFINGAAPQWVFNLNPNDIEVTGHVGVKLKMPTMVGSHEYVKYIGDRVVLVGLDPRSLQIVPVGVGKVDVDNNMVISEGTTHFQRLDIIGYGLVDADNQSTLEDFGKGDINLNELINRLE